MKMRRRGQLTVSRHLAKQEEKPTKLHSVVIRGKQ